MVIDVEVLFFIRVIDENIQINNGTILNIFLLNFITRYIFLQVALEVFHMFILLIWFWIMSFEVTQKDISKPKEFVST